MIWIQRKIQESKNIENSRIVNLKVLKNHEKLHFKVSPKT